MRSQSDLSILPVSTRSAVIWRRLVALRRKMQTGSAFDDLPAPELMGEPEVLAHRPVVFDPDQLDRVHSCAFGTHRLEEFAKLRTKTFIGQPAERYRLGECIIVGGTVITKQSRHLLRAMPELVNLKARLAVFDRATLLNTMQGLYYFGHWLQDDCPLYERVKDAPPLLSVARNDWPDMSYYETGFGQTWTETRFAHVGDLTVWRDLNYSTEKAQRIQALRVRLRKTMVPRASGRIVYISRGQTGEPRNMSNVVAFEAALRQAGVEVVEPGQGGQAMLGARIVISIEGSQACHGIYALADGGTILIIQPPERFYNPLRNWTSLLGLTYAIVVGQKDATSFFVNPDEVLRMVDRLLALSADR